MCGLFGVAVTQPQKNLDVLIIQLALENLSRGRGSWGVCVNGKDIIKDVGPVERALSKIPRITRGALMGHTRAPTVGALTQPNAHPWRFKMESGHEVIGMHNGSVGNWSELNKKYNRDFEVDSMHIFGHIADELDLGEVEASGAITFVKEGCLYLSKFHGGSLSVAQLQDKDKKKIGIAWSSEEHALRKCLESAGFKFFMAHVQEGLIYYYSKDVLWNTNEKIGIGERRRVTQTTTSFHTNDHTSRSRSASSTRKLSDRFVRLRIMRPVTDSVSGKQKEESKPIDIVTETKIITSGKRIPTKDQREALKMILFNDDSVSVNRGGAEAHCELCGEKTNRYLQGQNPTCLTCIVELVIDGKVESSKCDTLLAEMKLSSSAATTVEIAHA